jgi:Predicted AAA-ATPase/PD-(D/E)XK nuclease superfamily
MLKIPYGISDFKSLMERKYFYQDRTQYLELLEGFGSPFLLYLRPRRFGKSLMISTLHYYYGLQFKNEFDSLFGTTYIGKNPTPNAHKYLVLRFDFSGINTSTEQGVFEGFLSNVKNGVGIFLAHYTNHFTDDQKNEILGQKQPNEILKLLFYYLDKNDATAKTYILIDEYDHFANELISFNFNHFSDIITKNGFVRKFYEVMKIATSQGTVERIMMTGVSPITVDSLTSGFNIAKNISLSRTFHQMVGFEESEVGGILAGIDMPTEQIPDTLNDMRLWYNGYLFSVDANKRLYNPNMVLYFAQDYAEVQQYPREMLDPNVASDYSKIQKLFSIQGNQDKYLAVLENLLETGEITSPLTAQYSFERGFTEADLVSLLFYMGFLTIKSENLGQYTFTFPNYVIKKLYADYFLSSILQRNNLPMNNRPVNDAIIAMATTGNPQAFFNQVELIIKYFSTRDTAHFNENTLKAIIMSLLHQQSFYYIHSEYETDWSYMDVYLEAIRGQKPNFEVTLELKYVQKAGKKAVNTIFENAEIQLRNYLETPKFNTRKNIKSFVVVVAGDKLTWRELI